MTFRILPFFEVRRVVRVAPCLGVLLLFVGVGPAHAADEALDDDDGGAEVTVESIPIEEEVHSQVASFAVTKLKESPAVVTAVTRQEILESGARDLVDILLLVPGFSFGVDVQNIVGPGFRGLWGHEGKVLLLIDGKEMNELLYSTMQLGNEFPVELIERVEVVRGPGSVIYGGHAELAVINVITRSFQGSSDFLAAGTYGQLARSHARRTLTVSGRQVFESVPGLAAFASASIGEGQRTDERYKDAFGNEASLAGLMPLDPTIVQAGVAYRDLQASIYYALHHTAGIDAYDELIDAPTIADFEALHGDVTYTLRLNDRLSIIPRFNLSVQEPWREEDPASDFFYDKQVRRYRGRLTAHWAPIDALQVTAGGDLAFDEAELKGGSGIGFQEGFNGTDERVAYQNIAGFLELYYDNPIVDVVAGARYDSHSAFADSFVPRLVLLRSFGPVGLKAMASRAFRAPGIENISLGEDVRPERTTVYELEGTLQLGQGHALGINVFDVAIREPIIYSFDPVTDTEGYMNFARQGSRGFEVDYGIRGSIGRLRFGYSFYRPSGDNSDVVPYLIPGVESAFAGLPSHRATISGTYKPLEWLAVSPTATFLSERHWVGLEDEVTGVSPVSQLPELLLLNLFVRAEDVGVDGLSVGAGVYNLLGSDFRFVQPYTGGHAPLPALGREFLLRAVYHFDEAA